MQARLRAFIVLGQLQPALKGYASALAHKTKKGEKPGRMRTSYQDTIDAVGALRQSAPDTLRCLGMILDRSNADDIVRMYNTLSYPQSLSSA